MNPLISVNIATKDRPELLQRCIGSILQQSYQPVEINVLDDGSTPETYMAVEQIAVEIPQIRLYRNESSQGNARCRNCLLKYSNGELISFLDDDDYWIDPDKLKKQAERIRRHAPEVTIISCTDVKIETPLGLRKSNLIFPANIGNQILRGNGFIFNSTVLTTRHLLNLTGGFDEEMKRGVDSEFFRTCILRHHAKIDFLPDPTTVCRIFGSRMTTSRSMKDRRNLIASHLHVLCKHWKDFLRSPTTLIRRLAIMTMSALKP